MAKPSPSLGDATLRAVEAHGKGISATEIRDYLPGNSACRCARTTSAWRCSATAARGASMSAIRNGGLHSRRRARTDVRAKPKSRNSVWSSEIAPMTVVRHS